MNNKPLQIEVKYVGSHDSFPGVSHSEYVGEHHVYAIPYGDYDVFELSQEILGLMDKDDFVGYLEEDIYNSLESNSIMTELDDYQDVKGDEVYIYLVVSECTITKYEHELDISRYC